MKHKKCTHKIHKGERYLPITKFSRHPKTSDGYQSICKECNKQLVIKRQKKQALKRQRAIGKDPKKDYYDDPKKNDYHEEFDDYEDIPEHTLIGDL